MTLDQVARCRDRRESPDERMTPPVKQAKPHVATRAEKVNAHVAQLFHGERVQGTNGNRPGLNDYKRGTLGASRLLAAGNIRNEAMWDCLAVDSNVPASAREDAILHESDRRMIEMNRVD